MKRNHTEIMDVTLRDGSYAINFQFSALETKEICKSLEDAGVNYIEVGHGVGIGRKRPDQGMALCTDEEYMEAAKSALTHAKFGVFCIPGTASLEDIRTAEKRGVSFLRVGTNINEVGESRDYIATAKELGMTVMANYMKSYVASEKEFADCVKQSEEYGADVVYVVDSAGCMQPEDIERYYRIVRNYSGLKVGFHGHDNLGIALWNSICAQKLGFDFIDTSLQGLGRSSGNASTELLVANFLKRGADEPYDCKKLISAGSTYIRPLLNRKGLNGLDIYCGIAGFHTSYMKSIQKCVSEFSVNPYELILEYCKADRVNMDEGLLREIAGTLEKEDVIMAQYGFSNYYGNEQNGRGRNE